MGRPITCRIDSSGSNRRWFGDPVGAHGNVPCNPDDILATAYAAEGGLPSAPAQFA